MKKTVKNSKLTLTKTTIRSLVDGELELVGGGMRQETGSAGIKGTCIPGYTGQCSDPCWTYSLGVLC